MMNLTNSREFGYPSAPKNGLSLVRLKQKLRDNAARTAISTFDVPLGPASSAHDEKKILVGGRLFLKFTDQKESSEAALWAIVESQGLRLKIATDNLSPNVRARLENSSDLTDTLCWIEAKMNQFFLSPEDSSIICIEGLVTIRFYQDTENVPTKRHKMGSESLSSRSADTKKFLQERSLLWSEFLQQIRTALNSLSLMEVTTPSLVMNPGMEPTLEPFHADWHFGRIRRKYFLPTSPELHLKKMLALGLTDIYEIKTCFRNSELSELHEPEFQMLEWYRAFTDLSTIQDDLMQIMNQLYKNFHPHKQGLGVKKFSIAELFKNRLNYDLTPLTSREELISLCQLHEIHGTPDDLWNDLFHRLWIEAIEPSLKEWEAVLVYDFPPSQAALARLTQQGWADRFEFYFHGIEIANAFHELNDPQEQRLRFERDQKERLILNRTPLDIDEEFMQALEYGLPPSAGIALGLDRLFMVLFDMKNISEARAFSHKMSM